MGNSGPTSAIHVALLGDSSFDNGNWTDGPCVTEQVREYFPQTSLYACDGALIAAIAPQSMKIPADVTHVVVSVGGNDATAAVNVVKKQCSDGEQAILEVWKFVKAWERDFDIAITELRKQVGPDVKIVLCSIYSPCFGPFGVTTVSQDAADAFIALVADAMLRVATRFGLPMIDWRRVMNKVEDFTNPIEPNSTGGLKMAMTIAQVITNHPFKKNITVVYPQSIPQTEIVAHFENGQERKGDDISCGSGQKESTGSHAQIKLADHTNGIGSDDKVPTNVEQSCHCQRSSASTMMNESTVGQRCAKQSPQLNVMDSPQSAAIVAGLRDDNNTTE